MHKSKLCKSDWRRSSWHKIETTSARSGAKAKANCNILMNTGNTNSANHHISTQGVHSKKTQSCQFTYCCLAGACYCCHSDTGFHAAIITNGHPEHSSWHKECFCHRSSQPLCSPDCIATSNFQSPFQSLPVCLCRTILSLPLPFCPAKISATSSDAI